MKRYLALSIYLFPLGDCTANGISSKAKTLYIEHPEGPHSEFTVPKENIVVLRTSGSGYKSLVPLEYADGKRWVMMGGNFAYTSDSRFSSFSQYPLPIHDRVEN
jgi:hypothetical protein